MGGVCTGKVYSVTKEIPVYRVWNGAGAGALAERDPSPLGRWWSFSKPRRNVEDYRKDNAICTDWTPYLNRLTRCTLQRGALIMVGPGQSAHCKDPNEQYEQSDVNQVYLPAPWEKMRNFVTCNPQDTEPFPACGGAVKELDARYYTEQAGNLEEAAKFIPAEVVPGEGRGGLCTGKVFKVNPQAKGRREDVHALTIYRVWQAGDRARKAGPGGPSMLPTNR